ncbi:DUF1793-domain-containing protein [Lentinus tigrinus ALCF2SS1-7]|uniref:DUF1793-domain-containing protein n=1 Tax=Lentinus tigrinus ALCF2SS1-7 TaxID=1328758 RepID=UPI001165F204|nr:DUF1793-domain-containing protein [Lentinus tigrinus ALCF2SS1-7]
MVSTSLFHVLLKILKIFLLFTVAYAQQAFYPASIPLAVRSPYFSIWYNSAAGTRPLPESWPLFWRGPIVGWAGRIRIDGVTYSWMGGDGIWNSTANVTDIKITPTRTIFTMLAGPMNMTVTYLSPIEPSDWVNQSIPFSYVSVEAQSLDGAAHDVQMYSDISSELVTGIRPDGNAGLHGDPVSWQSNSTAQTFYHETQPETLQQYSEYTQQAEDGRGYYAMALSANITSQIDTDSTCRHQFANFGEMTGVQSSTFGPMGNPWYVFAIAVDFGSIQSTSSPVTWAIGYVRDPVVQFKTTSGATDFRRPYWSTRHSDIHALIDAFVTDYPAAHDRAIAFDERITADAAKISPQYVNLVSLVARQVMGALEITVPGGSAIGARSATDVKVFMKDIGYSQRISPVEHIFAAFPAYLYFNASLGGALLAPLLEYQDTQSGQSFASQDLGPGYPNATGTSPVAQQGIEQSGNMLIMMYAHARTSGDGSLLSRHYDTAKRWADYLVNTTLTPMNQLSADGLSNPNMTNLAIKGIIGVQAMAEISRAMQRDSDTLHYDSQAKALASRWLILAQSSDQQHLLGQYGQESSSALLYNIYADVLLGTNLVPQDTLSKQTQYYNTLLQSAASPLGVYFDNAAPANTASIAWTLFTAATVTDEGVRDQLIQRAWERAASNKTGTIPDALPDAYNDVTGEAVNHGGGAGYVAPLRMTCSD